MPPRPQRLPFATVASFFVAAVVIGFVALAARSVWTKSQRTMENQGDRIVEDLSEKASLAYQRSGAVCPAAAPVPAEPVRNVHPSTREDWENDPGWACLGFQYAATLHCQVRYDVTGDEVRILALYPTRSVARIGHIDRVHDTLVFDPIEHHGRRQ